MSLSRPSACVAPTTRRSPWRVIMGGSEPVFAEMMKAPARRKPGHTRLFVTPAALDAEGIIPARGTWPPCLWRCCANPKILEYSGIWMDTLRGGETQLTNTNKMLKGYAGITGASKRAPPTARGCASQPVRVQDGMGLLAGGAGALPPKSRSVLHPATAILDYGFRHV